MADVSDLKSVGAPFSNAEELIRVSYDFDVDGGAVEVKNLMTASGDLVIMGYYLHVETAVTSGGSPTVDVGIAGGDTDALVDDLDPTSLSAGDIKASDLVEGTPNVLAMPLKLASGSSIAMEIKTAALTAGKINHVFKVVRL